MKKGQKQEQKNPDVGANRQAQVGGYLIREKRRSDMSVAIDQGLHFTDAAERAGIPFEVAMSASRKDPEFSEWYEVSKDRPRLSLVTRRKYEPKTSLQIKSDFINKLSQVGLFDKICTMAEHADPETEEGKQVLGFFMRYIVKDMLPKETAAKVEHSETASYEKLTDAELLEQLHSRREKRIAYTKEIDDADGKRLSHTEKYIEQIEEEEPEDVGESE